MKTSRSFLTLAACVILAASLAGCAGTRSKTVADEAQARALWNVFQSQMIKIPGAFSLSASLTLNAPGKSTRVVLSFWGLLERPLRLDISASMGQLYARWLEDSSGWTGVYPTAKVAYTSPDTKKALSKLGLPLPFTLRDFAAMAIGRFDLLVGSTFTSVKATPAGYEYALPSSSPIASITLDSLGNPVHLTGRGVEPWTVDFSDYSRTVTDRRQIADKVQLTTPGGSTVILRLKKLELFSNRQGLPSLELNMPPQTRVVPLDTQEEVQAPAMP